MNATQKEEIDNLSRSLNKQLLSAHDCYRPFTSNSLISTLKRYVSTKLKFEDKSWSLIQEIRSKLYLIHEYNLEIFKLTHKYPRIRNFDLLLAKYIELEYEILYKNNSNIDRNIERRITQRILRLLFIIFQYNSINDELLTKDSDIRIKKAILKLFVDIKFEYFNEGRFIYNITRKLISEIDDNNRNISTCNSLYHYLKQHFSTSKNTTTSDYGSEDSDSDELNYCTNTPIPTTINYKVADRNTIDVEEVPVTKNGVQPIVTFEFINNDNDYMVYLSEKNDNHSSNNCDKIKAIDNNKDKSNEIVMLSSDDEIITFNTTIKQKKRKKKKKLKDKQQTNGVVTFEIMNDDNDDTNTYMVYLQKEVETNNKRKKLILEEPVILSDSDDEQKSLEIKKEPTPIKIEPSIGVQHNQQTTLIKNETNSNEMKIESNELDLKIDIIEDNGNLSTNIESFSDNDPCLNGDLIDISSIFQNIPNLSTYCNFDLNQSIDEYRLNDSILEEILETSQLSKRDFEDLECFLFDTTEKHSFSQYCEQYTDIDDISGGNL